VNEALLDPVPFLKGHALFLGIKKILKMASSIVLIIAYSTAEFFSATFD